MTQLELVPVLLLQTEPMPAMIASLMASSAAESMSLVVTPLRAMVPVMYRVANVGAGVTSTVGEGVVVEEESAEVGAGVLEEHEEAW